MTDEHWAIGEKKYRLHFHDLFVCETKYRYLNDFFPPHTSSLNPPLFLIIVVIVTLAVIEGERLASYYFLDLGEVSSIGSSFTFRYIF